MSEREYPFRQYLEERLQGCLEDFYAFTLCDWLRWIPEIHDVIRQEQLLACAWQVFPSLVDVKLPADRRNAAEAAALLAPPYADPVCVDLVRRWADRDLVRFEYSAEPPRELA